MGVGDESSSIRTTVDLLKFNGLSLNVNGKNSEQVVQNCQINSDKHLDTCEKQLKIISLNQLAKHDRNTDCWVAIYDYVYDCTDFIKNHPGGQDVIMEYAGRDATLAFIGSGHTANASVILKKYLIGKLPLDERLYITPNGIKIVNSLL